MLASKLREATGFRASTADAKKLLISIGFGKRGETAIHDLTGSFVCLQWIDDFAEEQRRIREADARAHPALMAALAGRRNPSVSAQYYIYADAEVKLLRRMCAVAARLGKLECREHDGCVIETRHLADEVREAMRALGIEVTVETQRDVEQAPGGFPRLCVFWFLFQFLCLVSVCGRFSLFL